MHAVLYQFTTLISNLLTRSLLTGVDLLQLLFLKILESDGTELR